jgi:hypothetical protein
MKSPREKLQAERKTNKQTDKKAGILLLYSRPKSGADILWARVMSTIKSEKQRNQAAFCPKTLWAVAQDPTQFSGRL